MDNKITGETTLKIGDKNYTLQYTWRAQAKLNALLEHNDIDVILNGGDPENLAAIIVFGLEKHHPEVTAEFILDQSPPLIPTVSTLVKALNHARFGGDAANPLLQILNQKGS